MRGKLTAGSIANQCIGELARIPNVSLKIEIQAALANGGIIMRQFDIQERFDSWPRGADIRPHFRSAEMGVR